MSKTVQFKMPAAKRVAPEAERWVKDRAAIEEEVPAGEPRPSDRSAERPRMKRFTIDVPQELHSRIKVECARRGLNMADELRRILEREFPPA